MGADRTFFSGSAPRRSEVNTSQYKECQINLNLIESQLKTGVLRLGVYKTQAHTNHTAQQQGRSVQTMLYNALH